MKTLYKSFIVFASALMLAPALSAQTVNPEKYLLNNGIGYNKYLKSSIPNSNGEYTLRLETFATGEVKVLAIPTDFVLVLDGSGSMQYDALVPGIEQGEMPSTIARSDTRFHIIEDDGYDGNEYYAYGGIFREGTWDSVEKMYGEGGGSYQMTSPFSSTSPISRYYYSRTDETYYRILGGSGTWDDDGTDRKYYYLYFDRTEKTWEESGGIWYVYADNNGRMEVKHSSKNSDGTFKKPYEDVPYFKKITSSKQIICRPAYGSESGNWQTRMYRPKQRREALIEGVASFVNRIYEENNKPQWATGVTKHQVAIVSFAKGYQTDENDITEHNDISDTDLDYLERNFNKTRVVKSFREISSTSVRNDYRNVVRDAIGYSGGASTFINLGIHLAKLLLEDLQGKTGMAPLNPQGGVNRNKVVILFTDGEISSGNSGKYSCITEGRTIKAARTSPSGSEINGKFFSIDYSRLPDPAELLQYLSSNYPNSTYDEADGTYEAGTPVPPASEQIYYQDAAAIDLNEVFQNIVDATMGSYLNSQVVAVDKLSDSFIFPSNVSGKVNFYTAQCIGTKMIDGSEYLAFAREIQSPGRFPLAHLWVSHVEGEGDAAVTVWEDRQNVDIDNAISFVISDDKKTITVKGFDYAALWCGHDGNPSHNNTRQPVASSDPNAGCEKDGYRGFKLIMEFPIILEEDAVGGPDIDTNDSSSGLYNADAEGKPIGNSIVNYPIPDVPIPVNFIIQKAGLAVGESASFTLQRRLASNPSSTYTDYTTFLITGDGTTYPTVELLNLDPSYHYCVKETGWSWSYSIDDKVYSTEEGVGLSLVRDNPILFKNTLKTETPKHAEAKAKNELKNP